MKNQTNLSKGLLLAFLTSVISGISIFYSKIAVVRMDPLVLTTSRNLFVGLLFVLMIIITRKYREIANLKAKERISLALVGLIGGSIPFYLFFTGLKMIGPQQANFLHKSLFIWVGLWSLLFLKEKLSKTIILSGMLVSLGAFIISPVDISIGTGTLMVFSATLFWSVETVLAKKILPRVSSELVGASRMAFGGLILLSATLLSGKAGIFLSMDLSQTAMIIFGGTLLFFYVFTWFKALSFAPAHMVTVVLTGSLVVGNVLSGVLAGIRLSQMDIYTNVLIGAGVIAVLASGIIRKRQELLKNEIPAEHE